MRRAEELGPADGALISARRASARLVDVASASEDPKGPWMVEAAVRRHVETLTALHMTPGTRASAQHNPLLEALVAFTAAESANAAEVDQPGWDTTDSD